MADNDKNFKFAMLGIVAIVAVVACFLLVKEKETYAAPDLQAAGQIEENMAGSAAGYWCIKCTAGVSFECYYLSASTVSNLKEWGNNYCGGDGYFGALPLGSVKNLGYQRHVN